MFGAKLVSVNVRHLSIGLLALGATACVIDTVPLPDERSDDTGTADRYTGPGIQSQALFYSQAPAWLVGVEGALAPEARLTVENITSPNAWHSGAQANSLGAFNLPIQAAFGDQLELTMSIAGTPWDSLTLLIAPPSPAATLGSLDLAGAFSGENDGDPGAGALVLVSPPNAFGLVSVSAAPGALSADLLVIVANTSLGASTEARAQADGSFMAVLDGRSGDSLTVFAVDPSVGGAGGAATTAEVP